MNKIKNHIKLYNLIFPIWILWMIPVTWIVVLPANFLIDLTVTTLTMKYLKITDIKSKIKDVITKVWILGFLSDFIGSAAMLVSNLINFEENSMLEKWWYENIIYGVGYNPLENIYAFLWVTACILITGICIYFFNYKICLKKLDIKSSLKKKISLSLAVFTAPYLFYIPTAWFF